MKKKNSYGYTLLKLLRHFRIVWLHSAAPLLSKYNSLPLSYWSVGNLYDSIVRMGIPLFFMLSGYLLLNKDDSLSDFFLKRVNKVVIPLFMWSIFYVLWKCYYEQRIVISIDAFRDAFFGPVYEHLWFVYTLLGLYLYIPILRIFIQNSSAKLQYYFVMLWFVAVAVIPFIN